MKATWPSPEKDYFVNNPNQNQPYDWGVPSQPNNGPAQQPGGGNQQFGPPQQPQQTQQTWPGQQGQPGQQPPQGSGGSSTKKLKPWLYTIVAILVIAAVVYAGLWIYQSVRGTDKGPLGWDNEQIAKHVSGSKLSDCDLGDEFFGSVGIKDVEVSGDETTCKGWYETTGGGEVLVTMEIEDSKSDVSEPSDSVSLTRDGLRGWSAEEESSDSISVGTEPAEKCTYYSTSGLFLGTLSVPASCGALKPLASQLSNLDIQDREATESRDVWDFSSPEYLEVSAQPVEVASPLWKKVGKEPAELGDAQKVEDEDYSGSTITMQKIEPSDSEVCAEATFKLGRETSRYSSSFEVPTMHIVLPTGSAFEMDRDPSSLRMKEGETVKLTYCGDINDSEDMGYRGGKGYVVGDLDYDGESDNSTWEFDFGKKA